ncbi:MAG TPA: fatty acid desaturase [Chthoniobacteraceae bacterium]|jgi:fatty acid desaturase|nr:fatty acid desaturase [Chthoniobacteraceae bacterium]
MEETKHYRKDVKIQWYRCKVDPQLMSELMKCSDWQGYRQVLGHLGLWLFTGTLSYFAYRAISAATWHWSVPCLIAALFTHGTVGSFMGGTACHELGHKTPFKTKAVNDFFLKVFAFFGWWDQVWFRPSHIRHHQVTVHHDYDGEVVLPQKLSVKDWRFWLGLLAWNPLGTWNTLGNYWSRAMGRLDNEWFEFLMPEENKKLRREHRNWARFTLAGHGALAILLIATGHWFLIIIFDMGTQYCGWLAFLCGTPQHYGMSPDVPDHRLSCRTFTCSWLPGFLYWNMQHHVEHHMFPAVPFFNLPRLRKAIEHDLPPANHGLLATWKEVLEIHRQQQRNPDYKMTPQIPSSGGTRADDTLLEKEAALTLG